MIVLILRNKLLFLIIATVVSATTTTAFQSITLTKASVATSSSSCSWRLYARTDILERILQERYPSFHELLLKDNADVWKSLNKPETVDFTIFCPTQQAFVKLGETKCAQLQDVRNAEATGKIGAYHVICESVTPPALFDSAGIITMGGQVPVDRSMTGGMFGIGGKEDGGIVIGGSAKVLQSYSVPCGDNSNAEGIIHEVDGLISPSILWRYMDQLRIPLSK